MPPETQFMSLNDDCLYALLEHLSLPDLCNIARTCKRLHKLSTDEYRMHRSEGAVLVINAIKQTNEIQKGPIGEKYVDAFAHAVRNVTFARSLASKAALQRLSHYWITNNVVSIRHLRIDGWHNSMTITHGTAMAPLLTSVHTLTLSDSNVVESTAKYAGNLYECVLQHVPQMSQLILHNTDNAPVNSFAFESIMNINFPKLVHFAWLSNDLLQAPFLEVFFNANPKINSFSVQTATLYQIEQYSKCSFPIKELFFTMSDDPAAFAALETLCAQTNARLHLKFPDGASRWMLDLSLHLLASLEHFIHGLYFEADEISDELAVTLTTLQNLKVLQLRFTKNFVYLPQIPSLETIYEY